MKKSRLWILQRI